MTIPADNSPPFIARGDTGVAKPSIGAIEPAQTLLRDHRLTRLHAVAPLRHARLDIVWMDKSQPPGEVVGIHDLAHFLGRDTDVVEDRAVDEPKTAIWIGRPSEAWNIRDVGPGALIKAVIEADGSENLHQQPQPERRRNKCHKPDQAVLDRVARRQQDQGENQTARGSHRQSGLPAKANGHSRNCNQQPGWLAGKEGEQDARSADRPSDDAALLN